MKNSSESLSQTVKVRRETAGDAKAVFAVNRHAFDGDVEAKLVDRLRELGEPTISLVAELDGRIVGHILFSRVTVGSGQDSRNAMALGPMAVVPELQRRRIGSKLVETGVEACRERGENVVFVLGHPKYYPRFGFQPAGPKGLHFHSTEFDPYFFVKELEAGALAGMCGMVRYHTVFDEPQTEE